MGKAALYANGHGLVRFVARYYTLEDTFWHTLMLSFSLQFSWLALEPSLQRV
jgi:hypothetical protein